MTPDGMSNLKREVFLPVEGVFVDILSYFPALSITDLYGRQLGRGGWCLLRKVRNRNKLVVLAEKVIIKKSSN